MRGTSGKLNGACNYHLHPPPSTPKKEGECHGSGEENDPREEGVQERKERDRRKERERKKTAKEQRKKGNRWKRKVDTVKKM